MHVQTFPRWHESDGRQDGTQARQWLAAAEGLLSEVGSTMTGMVEGALCEAHARSRRPCGIPPQLAADIDGRR